VNEAEAIAQAQANLAAATARGDIAVEAAWQMRAYGLGSSRSVIHDMARVAAGGVRAADAAVGLAMAFGTRESIEAAKINAARDAYVRGDIEIDEFEQRVGTALGV
jgi:hypothetical protein